MGLRLLFGGRKRGVGGSGGCWVFLASRFTPIFLHSHLLLASLSLLPFFVRLYYSSRFLFSSSSFAQLCPAGLCVPVLPHHIYIQFGASLSSPSQCSSTLTPSPTASATVPQVPDPLALFQVLPGFRFSGAGLFAHAWSVPPFSASAFTSLVLLWTSCQRSFPSVS